MISQFFDNAPPETLSLNLAEKSIFQLLKLPIIRCKYLSPLELQITRSSVHNYIYLFHNSDKKNGAHVHSFVGFKPTYAKDPPILLKITSSLDASN